MALIHLLPLRASVVFSFFLSVVGSVVGQEPVISRIQGDGYYAMASGEVVVVWGEGLSGQGFRLIGINPKFEEAEALAALEKGIDEKDAYPARPPSGSEDLKLLKKDPEGRTVSALSRLPAIIWAEAGGKLSKPVHSLRPEVWWTNPATKNPGVEIRVFGRHLARQFQEPIIALRRKDDGKVTALKSSEVKPRSPWLEARVIVPPNLAPGEYTLHVHNQSGGNGGWSQGVPLVISAADKPVPEKLFLAADHGAKGDGLADDTAAIAKALAAAEKAGGGIVRLGVGRFHISQTLEIPQGVSVRGMGASLTSIQVSPVTGLKSQFPADQPFKGYGRDWLPFYKDRNAGAIVWMKTESSLADLEIRSGLGADFGILVANPGGISKNIDIKGISIHGATNPLSGNQFSGILILSNTFGMSVSESQFLGIAITALANRHEQFYFGFNKVQSIRHGAPLQVNNLIVLRGTVDSIIEENEVRDGERNICFQNGMRFGKDELSEGLKNSGVSSRHTALIGNRFIDNITRRHNGGEIMFEGGHIYWTGHPTSASADGFTVPDKTLPFNLSENWALIVGGKGIGQYRRIVGNDGKSVNLATPWTIKPDATSLISVGSFVVEHIWIDNTDEGIAGWTGFWGSHLGHVVSGQINRRGEGLRLWAFRKDTAIGFIEMGGSWLSGSGNIALLGPGMVFGCTITNNEIVDFRFRPTQHGTRTWSHPTDSEVLKGRSSIVDRPAILLASPNCEKEFPGGPHRAWNVITRNLLTDGPIGIQIDNGCKNNFLYRNVIDVEGAEIVDEGEGTVTLRQFGRDPKTNPTSSTTTN